MRVIKADIEFFLGVRLSLICDLIFITIIVEFSLLYFLFRKRTNIILREMFIKFIHLYFE